MDITIDLLLAGALIVFILVTVGLIQLCDRLQGGNR